MQHFSKAVPLDVFSRVQTPRKSPSFRSPRPWLLLLLALATFAVCFGRSATARADLVLLLPAKGQVPGKAITGVLARESRYAIIELGHKLVPNLDAEAAIRGVEDGDPDNADEFAQMAEKTHADWVVAPRILPFPPGYGLELTAYQASSGRTETVTREIETGKIHEQVVEMAKLLLRPQGVGTDPLPWEQAAPAAVTKAPDASSRQGSSTATGPEDNDGSDSQIFASLGGGATSCVSEVCSGDVRAFGELALGWQSDMGLALQVDAREHLGDSQVLQLEGTARYTFDLSGTGRFGLGIEAGAGATVTSDTALTLRAAPVLEVGLSDSLKLQATAGDTTWVHADGGSVLLVGGAVRGVVQF